MNVARRCLCLWSSVVRDTLNKYGCIVRPMSGTAAGETDNTQPDDIHGFAIIRPPDRLPSRAQSPRYRPPTSTFAEARRNVCATSDSSLHPNSHTLSFMTSVASLSSISSDAIQLTAIMKCNISMNMPNCADDLFERGVFAGTVPREPEGDYTS